MINREKAIEFFTELDRKFGKPGTVHLVGETGQLIEGWTRYLTHLDFAGVVDESDRQRFQTAVDETASELGISAENEHPGEVVPLPEGFADRSVALTDNAWADRLNLGFDHFDPYSVSYRFIARGGETDYELVVRFLENGWISEEELDERLRRLLPELSFETIQQDPAELRRRYMGLKQIWWSRKGLASELGTFWMEAEESAAEDARS